MRTCVIIKRLRWTTAPLIGARNVPRRRTARRGITVLCELFIARTSRAIAYAAGPETTVSCDGFTAPRRSRIVCRAAGGTQQRAFTAGKLWWIRCPRGEQLR